MAKTLEELRAENAAAETENAATEDKSPSPPQADEDELEVEAVEDELEESTEDAESEEEEAGEIDTEEWMQGDSHESQAEKKYTGTDIGNAKAKLRAKLETRHEGEVEQLKQKIEALEGSLSKPKTSSLQRPKREDFFEADDPDEAYFEALTDWKLGNLKAEQSAEKATTQTAQKQQEQVKAIEKAVDQHYVRAIDLAEKSGISAEKYQSADLKVRQMVESVFPDGGDAITDGLIATLGEGSEKVIYNLGVNAQRGSEFMERLRSDNTGLKAATYLGQLNAELNAPRKRKTNAPAPAPDLKGDEQNGDKFRALKKKYDQFHKSGNVNEAFSIRREARKAGANTSTW